MPSSSPWSALWILDFLKCEKKTNPCPFQKLAEEASKCLTTADDLKNALTNVCVLIDKKVAGTTEATQPSRKRRRPSTEQDNVPPPTDVDENKRMRPMETAEAEENEIENTAPLDRQTEPYASIGDQNGTAGSVASLEHREDTHSPQHYGGNASIPTDSKILALRQLSLVSELCKLARLLCQMMGLKNGGVCETLDIDLKRLTLHQSMVVSRLFLGILMLQSLATWVSLVPQEEEVVLLIKNKVLSLLTTPHQSSAYGFTDNGDGLAHYVKDALTPGGLEDIRSLAHKLSKIFSSFRNAHKELITFALINPDETSPSRRAVLEKAVDLRRNLARLCIDDNEVPEGIDQMKQLIQNTVLGTQDLGTLAQSVRDNELTSAWLVSMNLRMGTENEANRILGLLNPHFAKYEKRLIEAQQKKAKAETLAKQKEEERKQAGISRLANVRPILDYLQWSEKTAKSLAKQCKNLNPCVVLGIPYTAVTKPVMKKLKLKVQANLHPDKFNLDWMDDEKRQETVGEINHAFRLVTESLNELQKLDTHTAKWLGAGPTKPPPYAAEIGLDWTVEPQKKCSSKASDMRRRSCPPPETPYPGSPQGVETTPAQHSAAASARNGSVLVPPLMPLNTRQGYETIVKDDIVNLCFARKSVSADANLLNPMVGPFSAPREMACRQGVCEFTIELKTEEKPPKNENRVLYIWLAAPKLKANSHNLKTRIMVQYCFPLTFSHPRVRLQLENVPLIGCSRLVEYEVMFIEVMRPLTTSTAISSTVLHTGASQFQQLIDVPALREGGVNIYRNSLNALYGLCQSDSVYKSILQDFHDNVEKSGGAGYIKNLRRQEARQLLESVNNDLAPALVK